MSSTWWESRDPFYQEALGKMDTILKGILDSNHQESMKHELFRTIAEKGNQRHPTNVIKAVLNLTSEWVLNSETEFIQRSGFQIYSSWSRAHTTVLEDFFNTEFLLSLLSISVRNPSNAVSLMHESIRILIRTQSMPKLLKIAEAKSIPFIHDHPEIETIKNFTVFLADFKECIPKGEYTGSLCQAIIMGMSKFRTPDDMDQLQAYIQGVNCIAKFLFFVWNHTDSSAVFQALKAIFGIIITSPDDPNSEPSVCLSSVIHYVPLDMIDIVTKNLVDDPNISDTKMAAALNHMIYWLSWPTSRNIDQWVMALLKTLAINHRFTILASVTETRVEQLLENLRYFPVREGSLNVLSYMLLSFQHSPHVFHKIIPHIPEIMHILRDERAPSASQCLNRLTELFHCLMHQHAGYPELYDPLFESIKDYPKPTPELIQLRLAQSKWGVLKKDNLSYVSPLLQKSDTGYIGLVNLGNSCYMNVIIQALFMCQKFRLKMFELPPYPDLVTTELQKVFAFLSLSQRGAYAPVNFVQDSRPSWFSPGSQQDCTEYIRYLLEKVQKDAQTCSILIQRRSSKKDYVYTEIKKVKELTDEVVNNISTNGNNSGVNVESQSNAGNGNSAVSFVEEIFGGRLLNVVKCLSCNHTVSKTENFTELYLSFPLAGLQFQKNVEDTDTSASPQDKAENDTTIKSRNNRDDSMPTAVHSAESSRNIHLNILIRNYLQKENMRGYHCEDCGTRRDAERQARIVESPEYLIISLKRFSYDAKRQSWSKILREVKYPKTLFLPVHDRSSSKKQSNSEAVRDNETIAQPYGLNSVIIHSGTSTESGHYYMYSRLPTMMPARHIEKVIQNCRGSGNDLDFFEDKWILLNDSRVSPANYKTFSTVSRRFHKDTAYMLIYRKINDSELKTKKNEEEAEQLRSHKIDVPAYLREDIFKDNTEYLMNKEKEVRSEKLKQIRKTSWNPGAFYQPTDDDEFPKGPPPPSCGGGGSGFGSIDNASRFVF